MKNSLRYDQGFARLEVEGVPDFSLDDPSSKINILLGWKLQLIGYPQLEGKLEHLQALVSAVTQYSRLIISGIRQTLGSEHDLVSIQPLNNGHQFVLRSTREGVNPLKIVLDDAELVDLTRCLDQLINDNQINLDWTHPSYKPLSRKDISSSYLFFRSLVFPLLGAVSFVLVSCILFLIPIPQDDFQKIDIQDTHLQRQNREKK